VIDSIWVRDGGCRLEARQLVATACAARRERAPRLGTANGHLDRCLPLPVGDVPKGINSATRGPLLYGRGVLDMASPMRIRRSTSGRDSVPPRGSTAGLHSVRAVASLRASVTGARAWSGLARPRGRRDQAPADGLADFRVLDGTSEVHFRRLRTRTARRHALRVPEF